MFFSWQSDTAPASRDTWLDWGGSPRLVTHRSDLHCARKMLNIISPTKKPGMLSHPGPLVMKYQRLEVGVEAHSVDPWLEDKQVCPVAGRRVRQVMTRNTVIIQGVLDIGLELPVTFGRRQGC